MHAYSIHSTKRQAFNMLIYANIYIYIDLVVNIVVALFTCRWVSHKSVSLKLADLGCPFSIFYCYSPKSIYFAADRSAKSFLTAFCSSRRKALTMRWRTQVAQQLPPYALETVFSLFLRFR